MSVTNGQVANQTTFNNAFVSRTTDTSTIGKLDLSNAESESGTSVVNVQRELNAIASYTGKDINSANDVKPLWAQSYVGASGDNLFNRADALTLKFAGIGGHEHTGVDGDGDKIDLTSSVDGILPIANIGTFLDDQIVYVASGDFAQSSGLTYASGVLGVGTIKLNDDDSSAYTQIKAASVVSSSYTITLPSAPPAVNGYILSANTSGECSWVVDAGGGSARTLTGTPGAPEEIAAGTAYDPVGGDEVVFVDTASGAVTVTANPQLDATNSVAGDIISIIGTSDTNYPIYNDGNGLSLNGPFNATQNSVLTLLYDGTNYVEMSRRV